MEKNGPLLAKKKALAERLSTTIIDKLSGERTSRTGKGEEVRTGKTASGNPQRKQRRPGQDATKEKIK